MNDVTAVLDLQNYFIQKMIEAGANVNVHFQDIASFPSVLEKATARLNECGDRDVPREIRNTCKSYLNERIGMLKQAGAN